MQILVAQKLETNSGRARSKEGKTYTLNPKVWFLYRTRTRLHLNPESQALNQKSGLCTGHARGYT